MATVLIQPDARRVRKDGTSQIKIMVCAHRIRKHISTGIHVRPENWDAERGEAGPGEPLWRNINVEVGRMRLAAEAALLSLPPAATIEEAAAAVRKAAFPGRETVRRKMTLVQATRRFIALKSEPNTIASYRTALMHVEAFGDTPLDDLTPGWLARLDAHMSATAGSANARAVYMRNIRAVCNYAIDEGWTKNYPFRRYKIRTVATRKRSLAVGQLRALLAADVEDWQRPYLDFFRLTFLLIGTNAKDILHLPPGADASGRIEFHRAKTKKLYSIKVEPEARAIIDRYRGSSWMLDVLDTRTDYLQYLRQCNHALQTIGTMSRKGRKPVGEPLCPGLTTYWARHTWATLAAELDIPKETIAAALGHDMGNSTTAIYINYNQAKVDDANRRVIDYVLGSIQAD